MVIAAVGTPAPGDLPPVAGDRRRGDRRLIAFECRLEGSCVGRPRESRHRHRSDRLHRQVLLARSGRRTVNNPLWIAQYTTLCPDLTSPWNTWAFWQYSESGSVPGISGGIDVDRFNGTFDELRALAGGSGGGAGSATCTSATMGADLPTGSACRRPRTRSGTSAPAAAGSSRRPTAGCTQTYAWCQSATLGRSVPPRTCVQAASDRIWYQCDGTGWSTPVDASAATGPAGACVHSYPL
jgi:hypothetical protein